MQPIQYVTVCIVVIAIVWTNRPQICVNITTQYAHSDLITLRHVARHQMWQVPPTCAIVPCGDMLNCSLYEVNARCIWYLVRVSVSTALCIQCTVFLVVEPSVIGRDVDGSWDAAAVIVTEAEDGCSKFIRKYWSFYSSIPILELVRDRSNGLTRTMINREGYLRSGYFTRILVEGMRNITKTLRMVVSYRD